jgi:DNA-directed RNA polymerase subunit M/transcription elongation factor TFIIS
MKCPKCNTAMDVISNLDIDETHGRKEKVYKCRSCGYHHHEQL